MVSHEVIYQLCELIVRELKKVNIEAFRHLICLSLNCQSAVVSNKHKQIRGYRPRWKILAIYGLEIYSNMK